MSGPPAADFFPLTPEFPLHWNENRRMVTPIPESIQNFNMRSLVFTTLAAGLAALFTSCSNMPTGGGGLAHYNAYNRPATLPSNPKNVRVKVSTGNQMLYVMEGNKPLLVTPISVGKPSSPTPKGNFRIFNKEHYHRANTHGYAYNGKQVKKCYLSQKPAGWSFKGTPMPYWCEFAPNYGFHTGWVKPYPCTHGCIRLHHNIAPKFFKLVSIGTPVNIATHQPEDNTIGRNVPRSPDAGPLPDFPGSFYVGNGYFTYHKPVKFENQ